MKLLMIGIDGGHRAAYARGWTPCIQRALDNAKHLPVMEDLVTRGWFRIATGCNAGTTGSLYDRPQLGGSTDWTLKFSMSDVPGFGHSVKPVWQVLSELGVRVGVMNLPTIYPAPSVNGFFVSGGGGGAPVVRTPIAEHCFPAEILEQLEALDYIVDERPNTLLGEEQMKKPREVFERLAYKNARRVDSFLKLAEQFEIEFGFVVFKSSSVIAELLVLPELEASKRSGRPPDADLMLEAEKYYREFDEKVEALISAYPEAEILMVSDHGSIVPDTAFNPNALLTDLGFQPKSMAKKTAASLVRAAKAVVPYSLRLKLKQSSTVRSKWNSLAVAPPEDATAFSAVLGSWRNGVFVNDSERFGGPVDPKDIPEVRDRVVSDINSSKQAAAIGVTAHAVEEDEKLPIYPDVIFSMPDNVCMSPLSGRVSSPFALPDAPLGLRPLFEGKQLAIKSGDALAANLTHEWSFAGAEESCDLRSVYRHVVRRFGGEDSPT